MDTDPFWLAVGFFGQGLFSMRFIVQWLKSEKLKRSVVPLAFWYFSLAGGVTLLAYAIHRGDPVFIVGQALGLVIYLRNVWLIHKSPRVPA
jgi:lipid-A-disaccharide synthase-like uncharacterized protein